MTKDLGDIAGRLYEVALDPSGLADTGTLLRSALDVDSSIMFASERATGRLSRLIGTSANFEPSALADYRAHYHDVNPWYQRGRTQRGHVTRLGEELIGHDEFLRTEFAADFCSRLGIQHTMGSIREIAPGLVVGTGVHRSAQQGPFSEKDLRLYAWLCDHLGRALQVAWKLQLLDGARITGFEVLDRLGIGVALLDNQGRPLFLNAVVDRLVSSGRWLTVVNGTLQPVHRAKRGAFAAAIDAAALTSGGSQASAGGLVRLPDPLHGALVVTIAPFRSQDLSIGQGNPAALVQFSDPDRPRGPQEKALRVAYGLSRGEARLVSALAGGERLADYAKQAGVSVNTARTQLARAFAKTGTARQTDLIIKVTAELSGLMAAEKKDPF